MYTYADLVSEGETFSKIKSKLDAQALADKESLSTEMETQVFQEKVDQITVNNVGDTDTKIDNSEAAMPEDAP